MARTRTGVNSLPRKQRQRNEPLWDPTQNFPTGAGDPQEVHSATHTRTPQSDSAATSRPAENILTTPSETPRIRTRVRERDLDPRRGADRRSKACWESKPGTFLHRSITGAPRSACLANSKDARSLRTPLSVENPGRATEVACSRTQRNSNSALNNARARM